MITLDQIRKRIAEAIQQSGLTQTEIARRLGIRQQTISHYIKGDKMPSLGTFANLCKILDVSADHLLGLSDY